MSVRWQDWVSILLGCWLAVSPWEIGYALNTTATNNAFGLGGVLVIFNLISACRIADQGEEIFNILMGAWLIFSPYALGFAAEQAPSINAMAVGIIIVGLAVWQLYDAARTKKR